MRTARSTAPEHPIRLDSIGTAIQHLDRHRTLTPAELSHEAFGLGVLDECRRRQPHALGAPVGALVEHDEGWFGKPDTDSDKQTTRLFQREPPVRIPNPG